MTSVIKGENNLLRYFSRRFGLFQSKDQALAKVAAQEQMLDSIYLEKNWGSGNVGKMIEPCLKQSPYLESSEMSLADVLAFSIITNDKGRWPPKVQDWLKRCDESLKGKS